MKLSDSAILVVPGQHISDADHWQSRWVAKLSTARRVEHDNWDRPDIASWTARIAEAVAQAEKPVVLVAHSLAVPIIAHAAEQFPAGKVRGGFLVAPVSEAAVTRFINAIDPAFAPFPFNPLPFPSVLVGSRNDDHCTYETAADYANAWGSTLIDAGESGHINSQSGHGPWPEGLMSFAGFMNRLAP
jgi:uncharacterized protein